MHVIFVLPDAYSLAILESGKISLNRELNVSAAAKGMLLLTIAMATFTSAEVTFERKKHVFSRLIIIIIIIMTLLLCPITSSANRGHLT